MKRIAVLLMIFTVLAGGCATILNPPYQPVSIITGNPTSRVYIDTVYAGTGDTIPVLMFRDCKIRQVKIETDSFKTDYKTIFPVKRSPWHFLSCILVFPAMFDMTPGTWDYEDDFYVGKSRPQIFWTPGMKRICVDKISFDVKKENNTMKYYSFKNYINDRDPYLTKNMDSVKIVETSFNNDFSRMLKKQNFIDTTNNVFIDNKNTVVLNCKVNKTIYNGVHYDYSSSKIGYNYSIFVVAEIDAIWSAMNPYGDTLFTKTITSSSGRFAIDNNTRKSIYNDILLDALEISWLDLMDSKEMKELCTIGAEKPEIFENMTVAKPVKSPGNIEDAMKACFTIKSDNGHGSGFLVSNDGYIITNYHVINNVKNLKAIDNEGKEFEVKVVRFSKDYDLALLKVEGNFEYAFTMPAEKNFKTGQDAYAIGTPKSVQLGQSLTKGIISGYRSYSGLNYIQTDISINKGNSGGAVISPAGDLLGVVEYKMFGFGTEGLSFSIPAFEVMKALALSYQ